MRLFPSVLASSAAVQSEPAVYRICSEAAFSPARPRHWDTRAEFGTTNKGAHCARVAETRRHTVTAVGPLFVPGLTSGEQMFENYRLPPGSSIAGGLLSLRTGNSSRTRDRALRTESTV